MPVDWSWSRASTTLGWFLALIVVIFVWMAMFFGRASMDEALVVTAICAIRL
jgi:hypothetical protein